MLPAVKRCLIALAALAAANATTNLAAQSASMTDELRHIEREWARIHYQVNDADSKEDQMRALAQEAAKLVERYPDRAEPLIWDGIVTSSEAALASMFSALGLAEDARDLFEKAGKIDYKALNGAVPTSLGALYYKVPGFPLGFGDNDEARRYLEQGLEVNPDGLDSNYFYADFLFGEGEYDKAAMLLKRALKAPAEPERPVWDAGRREEIRALLAKIEAELASNR